MLGEHFPEMVKIFMVKMLKFYDICSYLIVFFFIAGTMCINFKRVSSGRKIYDYYLKF